MNYILFLLDQTMPFRDVIAVAILAFIIGIVIGIFFPRKNEEKK